jgi:hypothetical protein
MHKRFTVVARLVTFVTIAIPASAAIAGACI